MQLKPLTKGRFHNIWQQDDALIEKIFQELLSETQIIQKMSIYTARGQVVDRRSWCNPEEFRCVTARRMVADSSWAPWNATSSCLVKWSFYRVSLPA